MATVEQSIEVNVPLSTAYNQWTQFESFPKFMKGVESVTQVTDTLTHWKTSVGGVDREFDAQIISQHPDEHIAWRSEDGKTHAGDVRFQPLDANTTRVDVKIDWETQTMPEKAGEMMGIDDMQVKNDLKRFKDFVESRGTETGAWRGEVD